MCGYCIERDGEQAPPVRLSTGDVETGEVVGVVIGAVVVNNLGTVYMRLDDGREIEATVPDWYGDSNNTKD